MKTLTAPGTWTGIPANSRGGCTLSIFARFDSEIVWAWRKDDNGLRRYHHSSLRWDDSADMPTIWGRVENLPLLTKEQAETTLGAICPHFNSL